MTKRKCGGEIDGVEMRVEVKAKAEEVVEKERAVGERRRMEDVPTNPESIGDKKAPPSPTPV
jgi:hypothetical protein